MMSSEEQNIGNGKGGLRPCPHCRGEISVLANTCMYCGKSVPKILKNPKELVLREDNEGKKEYTASTHFVEALGSFNEESGITKKPTHESTSVKGKIKRPSLPIRPGALTAPLSAKRMVSLKTISMVMILSIVCLLIVASVIFIVDDSKQIPAKKSFTVIPKHVSNPVEQVTVKHNPEITVIPNPAPESVIHSKPRVAHLYPNNGEMGVSPNITRIYVTFDRPMKRGSHSWVRFGHNPYPQKVSGPSWSKDGRTCSMNVNLKPNTSYKIGLNSRTGKNFRSKELVSMDPVVWTFTTGRD